MTHRRDPTVENHYPDDEKPEPERGPGVPPEKLPDSGGEEEDGQD